MSRRGTVRCDEIGHTPRTCRGHVTGRCGFRTTLGRSADPCHRDDPSGATDGTRRTADTPGPDRPLGPACHHTPQDGPRGTISLRSRLTRRTQVALIGVTAAGVAAAAVAVVPSLVGDESSKPATVAAQEAGYGAEPEAGSKLVTQVDGVSTMATATMSRDTMINRARTWLTANNGGPVPYSMNRVWKDGYRTDCSGYVSMALALGKPGLNTVGLADSRNGVTKRLSSVSQLQKGDLLIDYSTGDGDFRHVVIFEK
jgi:cell wall-associated NlpC family hydrolase